jgi:hypothetical protein
VFAVFKINPLVVLQWVSHTNVVVGVGVSTRGALVAALLE